MQTYHLSASECCLSVIGYIVGLLNDLQLLPCCHVGIVLLAILMNFQQVACIVAVL